LYPFSDDYQQARKRFLEACDGASAALVSHRVPNALGPGGEALYIDIARLGPADADTIVLCISGTHGAEGFPGSAAQIDWLNAAGRNRSSRESKVAVWLVHAANPFGFAWQMRNNEHNVDLNRNWVDFERALPDNPGFDELYPLIRPATIARDGLDAMRRGFKDIVERHGSAYLEDALTRGQYRFPDAYSFGGREPEFSRKVLTALVHDELAPARRVAYVDFHSGTRGIGELIFLCFSPPASAAFRRAASWWGAEHLDAAEVERRWGGKRPSRHGLMFWGLEAEFGSDVEFAGAVVEFGTLEDRDRSTPIKAGVYESWLRFEADFFAPESRPYIELLRSAFDRPGDLTWQQQVLEGARFVLGHAIDGAERWCAEQV